MSTELQHKTQTKAAIRRNEDKLKNQRPVKWRKIKPINNRGNKIKQTIKQLILS